MLSHWQLYNQQDKQANRAVRKRWRTGARISRHKNRKLVPFPFTCVQCCPQKQSGPQVPFQYVQKEGSAVIFSDYQQTKNLKTDICFTVAVLQQTPSPPPPSPSFLSFFHLCLIIPLIPSPFSAVNPAQLKKQSESSALLGDNARQEKSEPIFSEKQKIYFNRCVRQIGDKQQTAPLFYLITGFFALSRPLQ